MVIKHMFAGILHVAIFLLFQLNPDVPKNPCVWLVFHYATNQVIIAANMCPS